MAGFLKEMEIEFEEIHINKIWHELQTRFGFNIKYWKTEFNEYLDKQPRNAHIISVFFRFGNDRINPILNAILGRHHGFPTFNNLCDWVVNGRRKT